jgi:2-keto-4-pentenoate hydratase
MDLAESLYEATITRVPVAPVVETASELTVADAYKIQEIQVDKLLEEGQKLLGWKIGLTSKAMQEVLGVDQPDFGHLTDGMLVKDFVVPRDRLIQPKAEAEIAFVLKEDLQGPGITSDQVLAATDYVVAAIEVVDSRIENWRIGLVDTVADNASSGMYQLGRVKKQPDEVDLKRIHVMMHKNGEKINEGFGSAALGDPAYCVAWLANKLAAFGVTLKAGEVILSGALSAAIPAEQGDRFTATFTELGAVNVRFE